MKSVFVFSMVLATGLAQIVTYAPSFGYAAFGGRTALDIFQPTLNQPTIFYNNPGYTYSNLVSTTGTYAPAFAPIAAPAVVSPAAVVTTKSNVETTDEEATIVAEPVEGPLTIRAIFPVFASDLRAGSGSEEVIFLRPDQVAPIQSVTEIDVEDEPEEETAPGVIVPDFSFRSAPFYQPNFAFRSAPAVHPYFNIPYAALPYPALVQAAEPESQ